MGINYQKEMELIIEKITLEKQLPTLLLHSCCAPCSSYVLEYLSNYFKITVFYYNPNIFPKEEYAYRIKEQEKLINALPVINEIKFDASEYMPNDFAAIAKGLEMEPEGGMRCEKCYQIRLEKTAETALQKGFEYFTTSLSISPMKNAEKLNSIGLELARHYNLRESNESSDSSANIVSHCVCEPSEKLGKSVSCGLKYLVSDFKKKDGYKRSVELSKEYGLYRQDYCGCIYSKRERMVTHF